MYRKGKIYKVVILRFGIITNEIWDNNKMKLNNNHRTDNPRLELGSIKGLWWV